MPRLCQSVTIKRRNLPPLPKTNDVTQYPLLISLLAKSLTNFIHIYQEANKKQEKKQPDYIVTETLQVPPASSLLKPILITYGRLLMQIWDNSKSSKIAITINHATNLPTRSESEKWYTFISGRLIQEEKSVKTFKTNAIHGESPVWNETFLFDYDGSIDDANLEICVHDTQTQTDTRLLRENFIGMIILPLCEANLEDEPRWYELRVSLNPIFG